MAERVPNTSAEQQVSPESNLDKEKTSAAEFLVKFDELRTDVREEATKKIGGIEKKIAQGKNLLSTPKNMVLDWRKEHAQKKYDRLSRKQDASRFDFINRRTDAKTEKAYQEMQAHRGAHAAHNEMMQSRLEVVETKGQERNEAIAARREELQKARIAAIERKLVRNERRVQREKLQDYNKTHSFEARESAIKEFLDQPAFKKRIRFEAEELLKRQRAVGIETTDPELKEAA